MMSLRLAFAHTIAARAASLVVMAVGFAVLGRLLPPAAFGHFAVAMALYSLAQAIVMFGLRQLVISRPEDHSTEEISAAAGLSLLLALCLCLTGLAAAATLGGGPIPGPLAACLVPLSLALLVGPFRLGIEARLQRAMRFGLISLGTVLGGVADVTVAIVLALAGYGATALACGMLASQIAIAALIILRAEPTLRARPHLRAGLASWTRLRGWGQRMTLIAILPQISSLLMFGGLSALQGAAGLGLFNRAQMIHRMLDKALLDGITPVVLPAFSGALHRGADPRRVYRLKLDYLAALCWPTFALIALLADSFVTVLLGPGWDEAVPVVRILALTGLGLPVAKMSQKLFVAIGEAPAFLRLSATREAIRVPLAVAGAAVSIEAFAFAFALGSWLKVWGVARHLHRTIGGPKGGYGAVFLRAAGLTLAALAAPLTVHIADLSPGATLAVALPLAGLGWLAGAALFRHPIIGELRGAAQRLRRA